MMINKLLSFLSQHLNNLLLILSFVVVVYILIFVEEINFKGLTKEQRTIKVYVCGEVENPGVYEVPLGSRVQDVLFLAKLKSTADLESINLAKKLRDEDMIKVYSIKKPPVKININTANVEELSKLPGISKKTAYEIIEYRQKYGNFTNINELLRIKGITLEDLEILSQYIEF